MAGLSKFKLPTLTRIPTSLPRRPAAAVAVESPTLPGMPAMPPPHAGMPAQTKTIQQNIIRAQQRTEEARDVKDFTPHEFYIGNAKRVVSVLMSSKLMGDSAARDAFRSYLEYLKSEPDIIEDFISKTYSDNPDQLAGIVEILNQETSYETLAPLDLASLRCGETVEQNLGIADFCRKHRMPLLAASTSDLLLFGIVNPSVAEGLASAMLREAQEVVGIPRIDFLLLTCAELNAASAD